MQMQQRKLTLMNVGSVIGRKPTRTNHRQSYVRLGNGLQPRDLLIPLTGQQNPMPACLKSNQSMRHEQHIRVVYIHFSESGSLNLHVITVDLSFTNVLQSSPSARSNLRREPKSDSYRFSISDFLLLAYSHLMSDSNLLSRIDSVRARLVPLRDGL